MKYTGANWDGVDDLLGSTDDQLDWAHVADFVPEIAPTPAAAIVAAASIPRADDALGVEQVSPYAPPPPPTVSWAPSPAAGVEGVATALGAVSVTVNQAPGGGDTLASIVISAIPVGSKLTDGTHSFTASATVTKVNVTTWSLSTLTIAPPNDVNFTLTVTVIEKNSIGGLGTATAAEAVTVDPTPPTLAPVAAAGVEGSSIVLRLGASVTSTGGDANTFASIVIGTIPVGATLTDGTHTFTATTASTSVNIVSWTLSSLKITPPNDANFSISVTAVEQDVEGNLSAPATATESVRVAPLAPSVAWAPARAAGLEGTAIALGLPSAAINELLGDANTLVWLVISAIPVGAKLTDGTHSFTASTSATSLNVAAWSLSKLKITPPSDADFTLEAAAIEASAAGVHSVQATASETVTVDPLAATLAPVATAGVEGSPIALTLGAVLNGLVGDVNTFASIIVSAIPVGATLTDGTYSFTATTGNTSANVASWSLASLTITPPNDTNFMLGLSATEQSAQGNLSAPTMATLAVTVDPLAPAVSPTPASGAEGAAIALNLGVAATGLSGDVNVLTSVVVSAIPVGLTLTDGINTFTSTMGHSSVNIVSWSLSSLSITPPNDNNFTFGVAATEQSASGVSSATSLATKAVIVDPLAASIAWAAAPSAGVEGTAMALGTLAATVNGLSGDGNSLASLIVGAIPVGATLSDGRNIFTATSGSTSANVVSWSLSTLTITPLDDADFTLTATATEQDAEGNLSAPALATEAVNVDPLAPTLAPAAGYGLLNTATPLSLGATINGLPGDANTFASLIVSAIPVGATLTDGTNTFTATSGATSINIAAWALSKLTITAAVANFTLGLSAAERDSDGDVSTTTNASVAAGLFTIEWTSAASGAWGTAANWLTDVGTHAMPVSTDTVLINSPLTVTHNAEATTIAQLEANGPQASVAVSGGTLLVTGPTSVRGQFSLAGGTAAFAGAATLSSFSQTGGELDDAGVVTVSGAADLSGGCECGATTTTLEDGATFTATGFSLDGSRNLQLGGASRATGTDAQINLNGANPNSDMSITGSGTLTILAGATFNDETDDGIRIYATDRGGADTGVNAAVNNDGAFEVTGGGNAAITTIFNTTNGTDDVADGTLDLTNGGTDTGATYTGAGTLDFSGGARTLDAASSVTTANVDFAGGQTTVNGVYDPGDTMVDGGDAILSTTALESLGSYLVVEGDGTLELGVQSTSVAWLDDYYGLIDGTGALTVTGAAALAGIGTYAVQTGTGATLLEGATTLPSGYFSLDGGRTLENKGTLTDAGGAIELGYNPFGTSAGGGTIENDSGATFDLQGTDDLIDDYSGATSFVNAGTLEQTVTTSTSLITTAFDNSGIVALLSGAMDFAGTESNTNTGAIDVGAHATLSVDDALAGAGTVDLQGAGSIADIYGPTTNVFEYAAATATTLWLGNSAAFHGTVSGFTSNSSLDLADMTSGASSIVSYVPNSGGTSGVLTVTDGAASANLTFEGSYVVGDFKLGINTAGGSTLKFV